MKHTVDQIERQHNQTKTTKGQLINSLNENSFKLVPIGPTSCLIGSLYVNVFSKKRTSIRSVIFYMLAMQMSNQKWISPVEPKRICVKTDSRALKTSCEKSWNWFSTILSQNLWVGQTWCYVLFRFSLPNCKRFRSNCGVDISQKNNVGRLVLVYAIFCRHR